MSEHFFWVVVLVGTPSAPFVGPPNPDAPRPETVIRLTVQPMPSPQPALRYSLLPELKEMTPGNPIPNYLKCILDSNPTPTDEGFSRAALRQADRAARMDKPDWQILLKLKTDGIGLLLPDVQKMRSLAAGLQGRFRDEVAVRRFDDALVTAKTMFAMSRHMGEHPTIIGDLVGIALAAITCGPLEEMLEQPGCPNLYWALTDLPTPFIPLDKGLQGERCLIHAELVHRAGLSLTDPMTPAQLKALTDYIDRMLEMEERKKFNTRGWLDKRNSDPKYMAAARERVIDYGVSPERVAKFPPDQVLLIDEMRTYEVLRDDEFKLLKLPYWEIEARYGWRKPGKQELQETLFAAMFLPVTQKVRQAQARIDQRIALLRHVEAVRMFAAENGGRLPATLDEIKLPLPVDPFTGKPFRYELVGDTAHLRGSPPKGGEQIAAYNLHYEITLRK